MECWHVEPFAYSSLQTSLVSQCEAEILPHDFFEFLNRESFKHSSRFSVPYIESHIQNWYGGAEKKAPVRDVKSYLTEKCS